MAFLSPVAPRGPGALHLIATLGPASLARAADLAQEGATAFRLNASHLTPDAARDSVSRVRAALPDAPIVVDLQGAKMRLGHFDERPLEAGSTVRFALHAESLLDVPLPHPELFAAVHGGETLSADDDRLAFRVGRATPTLIEATVLKDGVLRPRKGLNVVEHPVRLSGLPGHDRAFLEALSGFGGLSLAFSFMLDGSEAAWIREALPGAPVIGKIERAEAIASLADIDARVDATWICRGDLGAQLGMAALGRFVGSLAPQRFARPMLMAGQVLEHLTRHPEPTRSEVCHLHDLLARGFAGVVLSDETAIGHDPVGAVAAARSLLDSMSG